MMTPRSRKRSRKVLGTRRTRMTPEEVREGLFECALTLFRSEGYAHTSVARLTRETGVAKGTFFNHFPTKEHILGHFMSEVWEESLAEAENEGHRGTDAIIHVLDGVARRLEANPAITSIVATRLASLPITTDDAAATGLLDHWTRWIRARLDESLPMTVPLQEVDAEDLAPLVTGAIGESLRASEHLPLTLGRRAVFLLRSAGFVAPDPPSLTRT